MIAPQGSLRVAGGWLALAALLVFVLVAAPGWQGLLLAALATIGLAGDDRLGWIGAAAVVALGVPFGVSASIRPVTIEGIPIEVQAVAIAIVLCALLPTLRWPPPRASRVLLLAISVFLALGAMATVLGIAQGHAIRDVLRDVRWWALYAVPIVLVLAGAHRARVLRGLVTGATVFALIVIATALLPSFPGGLKDAVLTRWSGNLRLQMTNSSFLTPILLFIAWRWLRRPTIGGFAWLILLGAAQIMSLTRVSLVVMLVAIALLAAVHPSRLGLASWSRWARRIGLVVGLPLVAFLLGVWLVVNGTPPGSAGSVNSASRLTFDDPHNGLGGLLDLAANLGRSSSYGYALAAFEHAPLIGLGMGGLIPVGSTLHPGVDDAPLTVGLKAGTLGIAAFGAMLLLPLWRAARMRRFRGWYLLAWLALLAVMLSQSFAVSGYGPFGVGLLMVLPFLDR